MISAMPDLATTAGAVSGPAAFEQAGITPADVDLLMGYDSFTITALLHLEDLGFCAKGEGGAFVADGKLGPGGSLPMNTNGGGLSYTHPGQYGMFLLVEAVRQLRGECGARQVRDAEDRRRARFRRRALDHGHRRARHGGHAMTARFEPPSHPRGRTVLGRDPPGRARAAVVPRMRTAVLVPARDVPALPERRDRVARRRPATASSTRRACSTCPGPGRDAADGPYVVALVDLDEGVRVTGNVLGCAPEDVRVGMPVRAIWEPLSDGRQLLQFAPRE